MRLIPRGAMTSKMIIRWLKLIFVLSTASFLFVQIQLRRGGSIDPSDNDKRIPNSDNYGPIDWAQSHRRSPTDNNWWTVRSSALPKLDEIRRSIEDNNAHAEVLNEEKYGPVENVEHIVVVQVHNRSKYLEQLIQSLSKTRGIEKVLVVFSHDYYSAAMNTLVRSIQFCRAMQIFYPYSIQLFPDQFPGQDPRDCPGDIGKDEAATLQCQNWRTPDKYGHFRIAKYSQVKHHWWWKMNYVFDGIVRLRNYSGWVLLLEEDHYVSPDFLYTFDYIVKNKERLCNECSVVTLGFYLKSYNLYSSTMNTLAVHPWFSSRHNMGMAINRNTWEQILSCSNFFCTYDDYNWDWSLMKVNLKCLPSPMSVIFAKSPRVFHIGDCGIHHTGKQCTADSSATKVVQILENVKDRLFPEQFVVGERNRRTLKAPKENGGWGDTRDHELCLNHSLIHLQRQNAMQFK